MERRWYFRCLLFLLAFVMLACAGTSKTGKTESSRLDPEQKAHNTFLNTTIVATGTFLVAFSSHSTFDTDEFVSCFSEDLTKKSLKSLDRKIADLNIDAFKNLDTLFQQLNSLLKMTELSDPDLYHELFRGDVMQRGVEITEKYDLPFGFRPFSQTLSLKEIKRYIIYYITIGVEEDTPMNNTLVDLSQWMQDDLFMQAPAMQKFMNRIKP